MPNLGLCHFFVLLAILFAAGCSNEQPKSASPKKEVGVEKYEPAYGDTIIKGSIGDATVLIPVLASDGASGGINGMIYNGLVKYDKDINLVPDLCEKWEISEDKLKIRFYLRKDVKWQDGKPFTVKDVKYTYEVVIDDKTPTAYSTDFKKVEEFNVIDDYTFDVSYKKPYAPALGSWGMGMLPAHLLEGKDITQSPLRRNPIGTGPYKFVDWKTGERITVESNHDYFEGRPYIDRVLTRIIPDSATEFLELKAGRLDDMGLTPLQYRRQTEGEWFKDNFNKYKYLAFSYTYLGYNLQRPMFADKRVRQALTMAINRQSIVDGVLLGLGQIAHSPYNPDTFWFNKNIKKWPYDPEAAKKLLAEAGWKPGADGVLMKDGAPFEFTIITNQGNDVRKNSATIIQSNLKAIGINVSIRVYEWAAFLKNFINKRNFDVCLLGWGIGIEPNQMDIWNSEKTRENDLNFITYNNPEVDKLMEEATETYDPAERKKYYDKFQDIISEDQPYTFLYVPDATRIISSRFQGITPAPAGLDYDFIKWFVPKPLQKYHVQQ